jgi:murein DD-endopeptidase MepM/ murein hydrolase activator NlpD
MNRVAQRALLLSVAVGAAVLLSGCQTLRDFGDWVGEAIGIGSDDPPPTPPGPPSPPPPIPPAPPAPPVSPPPAPPAPPVSPPPIPPPPPVPPPPVSPPPAPPVPPTPPSPPRPPPPPPPAANLFSYFAPGDLKPGSGTGTRDTTVFAPGIAFPIAAPFPAFLNSQTNNPGGGAVGGDQCNPVNYSYPWRDTFCEFRSADRGSFNCSTRQIHQGVDIRGGDAANCRAQRAQSPAAHNSVPVVAVDDGTIAYIGRFSVDIRSGPRVYRYLHLNPNNLQVALGDTVTKGQRIGYLSNAFGGSPTTLHLHFEIRQNMEGKGFTWVSPYTSLVEAYQRRQNQIGRVVSPPPPPR